MRCPCRTSRKRSPDRTAAARRRTGPAANGRASGAGTRARTAGRRARVTTFRWLCAGHAKLGVCRGTRRHPDSNVLAETLTPSAIVAKLDQYVIGQDEAKRIVAVAVYTHFKKLAR